MIRVTSWWTLLDLLLSRKQRIRIRRNSKPMWRNNAECSFLATTVLLPPTMRVRLYLTVTSNVLLFLAQKRKVYLCSNIKRHFTRTIFIFHTIWPSQIKYSAHNILELFFYFTFIHKSITTFFNLSYNFRSLFSQLFKKTC